MRDKMELRTISMQFSAQSNNDFRSFSSTSSPSYAKAQLLPPPGGVGLSGTAGGVRILGTVVSGKFPSRLMMRLPDGSRKVETGRNGVSYICHTLKTRGSKDDCSRVCVRRHAAASGTGTGQPMFLAQRSFVPIPPLHR